MKSSKLILNVAKVMMVAGLISWAVGCESTQTASTSTGVGMQSQPQVQVKAKTYEYDTYDAEKSLRISMTAD